MNENPQFYTQEFLQRWGWDAQESEFVGKLSEAEGLVVWTTYAAENEQLPMEDIAELLDDRGYFQSLDFDLLAGYMEASGQIVIREDGVIELTPQKVETLERILRSCSHLAGPMKSKGIAKRN